MNIAFEISPLISASGTFGDKSGVYRYRLGLLTSLIRIMKRKNKKGKIILFSFNRELFRFPLNPEIAEIAKEPNVIIPTEIPELREKSLMMKIKDVGAMDVPVLRSILIFVNHVSKIEKIYDQLMKRVGFHKYYNFLDQLFKKYGVKYVFHSETGFFPMRGYKNIITIYDLTALTMPEFHREETCDLQERKVRFARLHCDGIICISKSTKKDLLRYAKVFRTKKIEVCYPGLDSVFQSKVKTGVTLTSLNLIISKYQQKIKPKRYLLYYGTFEPRKNLEYLMKSFLDLQDNGEIQHDFKLILIGGSGWGKTRKKLKNHLKETYPLEQKRNVIIMNYLSDEYLVEFIKHAYALVYPSIYEGFGLPILESMALGTPVLCTYTSSLPEVGGSAVVYTNPIDIADIKRKIKMLIKDKEMASELSAKGLEQSKKFRWEKTSLRFIRFLERL